ncbi:ribbon-helix-helix protein, CopG family [Chloroflexota bacterium]
MSTLHRAQLLLESEQHAALAEIAEQEGRSISDLVREIVRRHLAERAEEAKILTALQAIERLTQNCRRLGAVPARELWQRLARFPTRGVNDTEGCQRHRGVSKTQVKDMGSCRAAL